MKLSLFATPCEIGCIRPLVPNAYFGLPAHTTTISPMPTLKVGMSLATFDGQALFKVTGRVLLPTPEGMHGCICPLLRAERPFKKEESLVECVTSIQGRSLACITLSDKGAMGLREDKGGPAIAEIIRSHLPLCYAQGFILPDEAPGIRSMVMELAGHGYDLICTTGGTGLSARDVTPEAVTPLLERRLPGFEHAMMAASLAKTPHAAISRAVVGTIGKTIVITLPGSIKAVRENLDAIAPALAHALDKLNNDPADCGG